jgi:putative ABC transport system permease protein
MLFSENIRIALRALQSNKMRSVLTMLGIVIGVATVVALLAIGNGATSRITNEIQSGSNMLTVMAGRQRGPGGGGSQQSHLYYSDYELLQRVLTENASTLMPTFQSSYELKYDKQSFSASVIGVMSGYEELRSLTVDQGRSISSGDEKSESLVVVLGSQTAKDLFGSLSPIDKEISINGAKFKVVGVLKSKGSGFGSADDAVLIPLSTGYSKLFGSDAVKNNKTVVSSILVPVPNTDKMTTVSAQIEYVLRRSHNLKSSEESDFNIQNPTDMLATLSSVTQTLTIFLGAIAGISLLVGGIGIMNIMLVSVTERTKEIGLRKAVGATRNQILVQFLIETLTLSIFGGIIGILFGISIALTFTALGLITAVISPGSIIMAFTFAMAIGIFFGLYPAYRAANLHPMVALRYE